MPIREDFDYTFIDSDGVALRLDARIGQGLSLRLVAPSKVVEVKPTREQWLEFRATLNHMLDADDVTAASAVEAKEAADPWPPTAVDEKATFERWLDKQCLDDTDLNDPEST